MVAYIVFYNKKTVCSCIKKYKTDFSHIYGYPTHSANNKGYYMCMKNMKPNERSGSKLI